MDENLMNIANLSYTLDSTLARVDQAEQTALQVAAGCGFNEEECGRIAMAVREATMNAVLHGNCYDSFVAIHTAHCGREGNSTEF